MRESNLVLDYPEGHNLADFRLDSPALENRIRELDSEQRLKRDGFKRLGDWKGYIFLHIRKHRWKALQLVAGSLAAGLAQRELAELFREVWIDSEHIWEERRRIRTLVALIEPKLRYLFSREDWRAFKKMPPRFTIYRGAKDWNRSGMSWTDDIHRAIYFATHHHHEGSPVRLDQPGCVYEKVIDKADVLFCTNEGRENEIVTRHFARGRVSKVGNVLLAAELGPEHGKRAYEEQVLSKDEKAQLAPYLASWDGYLAATPMQQNASTG